MPKTRNLYKVTLRKPIQGYIEMIASLYATSKEEAARLAKTNHEITSIIIKNSLSYKLVDVENLTIKQYQEIVEQQEIEKKKKKAQKTLATKLNNQNKYTYISRKSSKSGK